MEPTKNNGPMDKVIKEEPNNQNEESGQTPNLQPVEEPCDRPATSSGSAHPGSAPVSHGPHSEQEEEPHETHSLNWCWGGNKTTNLTCNKAGTVEDLLRTSQKFKQIADKNKNKELVIERDGKAISSHFPCSLIKMGECLTVKYMGKSVSCPHGKTPSGELVEFNVLTKGGKNIAKIMRNPALKAAFTEITVYAYKGEKVKRALKRDGRFLKTLFKKNWELCDRVTKVTYEMSGFVDDLDGKTLEIILINKDSLPESQPSSLDDDVMQNESQRSDSDGNQNPPQQSTTPESVNDSTPKEKPKPSGNMAPENTCYITLREMPNSKRMQDELSKQFKDLVKGMKTQKRPKCSRIHNLFRVDFGKSVQTCREVKTMKKLMDLSNYVCQVRINGNAEGSGFLLFDKFVLTNGHVIEKIYNGSTRQLNERVTVHFSFESLQQMKEGQGSEAEVEEVVGFEYYCDVSKHESDWALLKLRDDQKLPDGLLTRFGFLPESGAICIIGHPEGGVKKIDPCFIIPTHSRKQAVERHYNENPVPVQLLTGHFFGDVGPSVEQRQVLTYGTCFYYGSSGSPVFDEHCNVVAMHTGGFPYRGERGEVQSVIEFGHPLSIIIERIIVWLVERERFDVLKKYLACSNKNLRHMMTNLKRLVESRNLTAFKDALNNSQVNNDASLKEFFDFISQREEPVPMDIC